MPRQHDQTGPYERPHDDWSGPMQRIRPPAAGPRATRAPGPPAAAPRYAAGNYNDWSGPLERIDTEAPPAQYGAPSQYGAGGSYGGSGQSERPRAEPRYERTGEIDRSSPYEQLQYEPPQYHQAQYEQVQY